MPRAARPTLLIAMASSLGIVPFAAAGPADGDPSPVSAVEFVDLERYAGLWYEVARIPNRFQKQCARGTTASYSLRDDGRIAVVNRCFREDGTPDEAKGVARVTAPGNAKLEVSFVSIFGWRPFWGDYWVIGLDPEYRWAVVGTPDRKFGWILARTPTLDAKTLEKVFSILARNRYPRERFVVSPG